MFETSSVLNGYGYGESAVEISLNDTIINDDKGDVSYYFQIKYLDYSLNSSKVPLQRTY